MRKLITLLAAFVALGAVAYTVIETDQGKIAVNPGNAHNINIYSGPIMGLNGVNFLPVAVDSSGALVTVNGGGGGNTEVNLHDAVGNGITSTVVGLSTGIDANIINIVPVSQSGTWNINNVSGTISLPTGASTSANQATANASLSSIDGKLSDNYGAAAGALRTASQVGNATGAADFNFGTVGAQTMRVASQVGNATGAASFGAGATGTQTLRTASNLYDGSANALTSQASGGQRALDVGVDVSGTQVDPRAVGVVRTSQPSPLTDGTNYSLTLNNHGLQGTAPPDLLLASWGKMFTVTTGILGTGSTSEVAYVLIDNPSGSGVTAKFRKMTFGVSSATTDIIDWAVYRAPTVTSNGTPLTVNGNRQTGQATAQVKFYSLPTTSSFGTKLSQYRTSGQLGAGENPGNLNFSLWLEANNKMLVTVVQAGTGANKAAYFDVEYAEQ